MLRGSSDQSLSETSVRIPGGGELFAEFGAEAAQLFDADGDSPLFRHRRNWDRDAAEVPLSASGKG